MAIPSIEAYLSTTDDDEDASDDLTSDPRATATGKLYICRSVRPVANYGYIAG